MARLEAIMRRTNIVLIAAFISPLVAGAQVNAETRKDPHRPACIDAHCQRIESFLRSHYCGETPYGDGPDGGCDIKIPKERSPGIDVLASFHCDWSDAKNGAECAQRGEPSAFVRNTLMRELRRLGLPAKTDRQPYFRVWKSTASSWSLAAAYYSRTVGLDLQLCQVIVLIDQGSHVHVLRKSPFQTTDVEHPAGTQWSPIDFADADGDGQVDIILLGEEYENHWLEVVSVGRGPPRTVFSGLGYYL